MSKIVPQRVLDDIRFRSDIVDVVGSYFSLQRAGGSFKALCPFHKEKSPSFTVNPKRQSYHCFGCGAGGDVFSFVMQHEGIDFMAAVKLLADRSGIRLEIEEDKGEGGTDKALLYRIHEEVAQFYRRCLLTAKDGERAREYLRSRDLDGTIGEEFLIGYAPGRWDAMEQWGRKHGFDLASLDLCGLLSRKESEGAQPARLYDRFRDRVMFPIRDEQGRIIAFSGRTLEAGGAQVAKYVNSPETPLFKKSRVLYALDRARRNIVDSREALVCEGQIDVIRCHQHGFNTAVASQGTAFTADHARMLKRYADSVLLLFDADTAGRSAAVKTARVFIEAGLSVKIASLPGGLDPDDFLRKRGADEFKAVLAGGVSAVSFQVELLRETEGLRGEAALMRAARALLETVGAAPSPVLRAQMLHEASERLGVPERALTEELPRVVRSQRSVGEREEDAAPAEAPIPPAELALCEHLAHIDDEPEMADVIEQYLPLDMLSDPRCRQIAEALVRGHREGRELHDLLRESGASEEALRLAAQVESAPEKTRGGESSRLDAVKDYILDMWRRRLKSERQALDDELARAASPEKLSRRRQITMDLKALGTWKDGSAVIELERGV